MGNHVKALLKVICHFEKHTLPSERHKEKYRNAKGLFLNGSGEQNYSHSSQSKRKGACNFLVQIYREFGLDIFLLCSFAFSPTTLYHIGQLGSFNDVVRTQIIGPLHEVSGHFGLVVESLRDESEKLLEEVSPHAQAQVPPKHSLGEIEVASQEAPAQRVQQTPITGDGSSSTRTVAPNHGPPLLDAPFNGKVYSLSVINAVRLLVGSKEPDLEVQITMPDSSQWPFVTFRCDPRQAMQYLTESDLIM